MPGVPVGVVLRAEGVGERPVRLAAFPAGRRLVHRGADQRVPHPHRRRRRRAAARTFRRRRGCRVDTERPRPRADGRDVPGVVGRGDQQQRLRVGRQPAAPVEEDPFHAGGERQLGGQRCGAGSWSAVSVVGSSTRASGFPAAWSSSRSATSSGTAPPAASVEQRARRVAGQRRQATLGTPSGRTCGPRRRGRRTRRRPGRRRAAARRPAPRRRWPGPATARRRPRTAPVRPRRPRSASTGSRAPTRNGSTGDVVLLRRTRPAARGPAGREPVEDRGRDAAAGAARRTPTAPRTPGPGCAAPARRCRRSRRGRRAAPTSRPPVHRGPAASRHGPPRASSRSAARRARSASRPCSTSGRYSARLARCGNPAIRPGRPRAGTPTLSEYRRSRCPR